MWKCITFLDSFRSGKRIIIRDQIINMIKKILEDLAKLNIAPITTPKEAIKLPELQPHLDRQNLISKLFVPALSSNSTEYDKHITGMLFVEIDPLLEQVLNTYCFEEKKLWKCFPVREHEVEKIINSLDQKIEKTSLKIGDVVEVIEGDYKGIIGRIEGYEGGIFSVHVQIFGCDQSLKLFEEQIRLAEND